MRGGVGLVEFWGRTRSDLGNGYPTVSAGMTSHLFTPWVCALWAPEAPDVFEEKTWIRIIPDTRSMTARSTTS